MNNEMGQVWQELLADITTTVVAWQLLVILASLLLAWSLNGLLRSHVLKHAPENWKIGIGGINRILFPLTSLLGVYVGRFILSHWQHTGLLKLAATLLLAMALIRLVVYALRYIFAPSGWVRTMENAIASMVWIILALYLSDLLPEMVEALKDISFSVGKHQVSVLLILQALFIVLVTLMIVLALYLSDLLPEMVEALKDISFSVGKHQVSVLLILQALFIVLVTLMIALSGSRFLENKLMRAEQINMNLRVVLSKLIRVSLALIALLLALSAVGIDITLLSVFGGALGVGLGFGLQKIASNYVSGFIILLDESVHMGDVITVDGHYGVISILRARYMVLRKLDGTEVVIPNEVLITNAVINHSFTDRKARVQMPVQVSYESPLELAMQLMQKAADNHPRVLIEPAPSVLIKGFGESGIDLGLTIWIPDPEEGSAALQSAIYLEIWRAFQQHGISIPYPQREVRILGSNNSAGASAAG